MMAIYSIPESNKSVNVASAEPQKLDAPNFLEAERLKLEAEDAADIALKSASEIVLDGSNKVTIPGYAYTFEALGERILVSLDIPLSGYECKTCLGRKRIKHQCECVTCGRAGKKYTKDQIEDIRKDLGDSVADARASIVCPECGGNPDSVATDVICPECKGVGGKVWIPRSAKEFPTTGVVVSMGSIAREKAEFRIGDRILFGRQAGTMIPNKAGLPFKYMDYYNGVVKIEGAEAMAAFDFVLSAI
jgi:co-chaperonin GroES (HSP10)